MTHFLLSLILAAAPQEQPAPAAPTAAVTATAATPETRSSLIIEPKSRAQDYTQAFELLRREKPSLKINIQTSSGQIPNVAELSAADNGTLMLVKIPFSQGTKYLIIPIEDIQEISYSP